MNQRFDQGPSTHLKTTARAMAVECRRVVQASPREEEWHDCDREFASIILRMLAELSIEGHPPRDFVPGVVDAVKSTSKRR